MVGKGHRFLKSGDIPQLDSLVMRSSGKALTAGLHGQRFYGVHMYFFIEGDG